VYEGSTDTEIFENFVQELFPYCGKCPAQKSVLIMDNASFHRSDKIQQMCDDAGVVLLYLPPYSYDFNPIEGMFGELKTYINLGRFGMSM
jgi:transposase